MIGEKNPEHPWRDVCAPFQERSREYDDWFVDNPIFSLELATLKAIKTKIDPPGLEVGIGPGRFAQQLGIKFGLDPALQPLLKARRRGVLVCRAIGEELPFRTGTFGSIFLLFSLCFLAEPRAFLRECHRTLKPEGHLIIGLVPAGSPWGRLLSRKGEEGHPFYRLARFRTIAAALALLQETGFTLIESISALFTPPQSPPRPDDHRPGQDENAGFAVLVAKPAVTLGTKSVLTRSKGVSR